MFLGTETAGNGSAGVTDISLISCRGIVNYNLTRKMTRGAAVRAVLKRVHEYCCENVESIFRKSEKIETILGS